MEIAGITTAAASGLSQIGGAGSSLASNALKQTQTGVTSFDSFLNSMLEMYNETDTSIKQSQQMQLDIATGESDDVVGLTLAMEKASNSLSFTVQVTNRILEAYKEIMRMQL